MAKKICVIGAGLAGGIIASELSKKHHDVTLLEYGAKKQPYDGDNEKWIYDKPKASFTRGIGLGGTSNFWHGGLTILDKIDIDSNSLLFKNTKLPIKYSDLYDYYNKAIDLLKGTGVYSLMDIESCPDSAGNDFNINNDYFDYKGLVYPASPFSSANAIAKAVKENGLSVIDDFNVKKINFSNHSHAVSVEGCNKTNGLNQKINADIFIICAGGLGSPKILLESKQETSALADMPIGKYLIDHPTGFVFKAKLRNRMCLKNIFGQFGNGYRTQYGFKLKQDGLDLTDGLNHILFLRPALTMKDPLIYDFLKRRLVGYKGKRIKITDILYLLRHPDLLFDAVNFKYGLFGTTEYISGLTFTEQLPDSHNRIELAGNNKFSIKWKISSAECGSVEKFIKTFFNAHSDMFENFEIYPGIGNRLESAGHHSGGCRMSFDSSTGVVDSDLKIFGVDNVFVSDGSVLGYSGHANTGLTISALALKCVDQVHSMI
ncbi:MAG: FAD-dependent oxidoreductase [Gammaproteobacteria bacterium]|nr:FAD-dependent oxidoreductase [Gammaproteobacteria bacterium]